MVQAGKMEKLIEVPCIRMPLIEVQKKTKAKLLRFAQSDRNSLPYIAVIQGRLFRPWTAINESRTRSQ